MASTSFNSLWSVEMLALTHTHTLIHMEIVFGEEYEMTVMMRQLLMFNQVWMLLREKIFCYSITDDFDWWNGVDNGLLGARDGVRTAEFF